MKLPLPPLRPRYDPLNSSCRQRKDELKLSLRDPANKGFSWTVWEEVTRGGSLDEELRSLLVATASGESATVLKDRLHSLLNRALERLVEAEMEERPENFALPDEFERAREVAEQLGARTRDYWGGR